MAEAWHTISPGEALGLLESRAGGLSEAEAAERLARHGPNVFQAARPVSAWVILLGQLRSVIVLLLAVAGAVAALSGETLDAAAIAAVLLLNVAIGFTTELRARRAMESLQSLEVGRARVVRDGQAREVDARVLVPGDIIEVEAGQAVPADARLIESTELRTVEGSLTGESVPVDKRHDETLSPEVPLPDRVTMLYKATTAVAGRGRGLVVATGMNTEVGRIGALASGVTQEPTPLERRLDQLGRRLAGAALAIAALVAGLGVMQGASLREIVQTAIALAVAAVPEGLPVVGTIAMAVGVHRMAKRRALVRRLPVVETLGAVTVICTDKTGTLTAGTMTVTAVRLLEKEIAVPETGVLPDDERLLLALRVGALANRSDGLSGDPTEAALVRAARRAGLDPARLREAWPEEGELPFSTERMLMATFHRTPGGLLACVKGAPHRVVELSDRVYGAAGVRALGTGERDELLRLNCDLAARGLRVLAVALAEVAAAAESEIKGLAWVGFVGLSDPPAAGVAETISAFRDAGIRTVMVTGDQKLTADAVARAVGVSETFSRVSPEEKLRIVTDYQRRGDIVAMLGDGINDAAALKKADVGVAMGIRGTDLAKEAADVILQDDRFPTISAAIEEGRVIFGNVRKFVFYLFSCNLAEILVFLGAGLAGFPAPLLPLQILWLNLLTDTFPALALAVEPGEPGIMRSPPRHPAVAILPGGMIGATVGYALLIALVALAAFAWGLEGAGGSPGRATTMAFMALAFGQISHLGNARSSDPVVHPGAALANPVALVAALLAIALQLSAAFVPVLALVLRLTPLSGTDWAVVAALGALPGVAGQTVKLVRRSGRGR
jgi:Ca2+-transporting ATPase